MRLKLRQFGGWALTALALCQAVAVAQTAYPADSKHSPYGANRVSEPPVSTPAEFLPAVQPIESPIISGPVLDSNFWKKVPPVEPPPRAGWPVLPPAGPGYYSLRDRLEGRWREKPPKFPYPPTSLNPDSFFNADFRYLDDPANEQFDFFDRLKRWQAGDNFLLSNGGEFRYRHMSELNSRLRGIANDYEQFRARVYGDLWFRNKARVFIEFVSATQAGSELPPLVIDRNPADFLNLFIDWKVLQDAGVPVYLRVGRQELLFGSQRMVSPLEWANTRRTFEGFRAFWHSPKVNIDVFAVRPVIPNINKIDDRDVDQTFTGLWVTKKIRPGTVRDYYVLFWSNARPVVGRNGQMGGQEVTTFGTRWAGDHDGRWLYDFEGMYQTGNRAFQTVSAGAYAAGIGYRAKDLDWNPSFWAYNEWASGTADPATSLRYTTFNPLFPFGHLYFGWLDLVGRQNINDFSMQLSAHPAKWIVTQLQYHRFSLVHAKDALYNAGGAVLRRDPAGGSGRFVGQEFDSIVNLHLSAHQDLLFGYSVFFPGEFVQNTGNGDVAHFLYSQYSFKW